MVTRVSGVAQGTGGNEEVNGLNLKRRHTLMRYRWRRVSFLMAVFDVAIKTVVSSSR